MVGQASACQRPLAGASGRTFIIEASYGIRQILPPSDGTVGPGPLFGGRPRDPDGTPRHRAASRPEEIREAVKSNQDLAEGLGRMEQHLAANNVDLKKTPATLGAVLKMDPQTERFIDNAQADQMLTREYREPFVVPKMV